MEVNATDARYVVTARGVRVGQGERVVLEDVDLDIRPGEIFGIVGSARSGKTALLETLMGLRPPLAGEVTLLGSVTPVPVAVRQRVGSSLRPSTVERRTTVEEALTLCARLYDVTTDLRALMQEVGLWELRTQYRERLAPHELARLSLAMGLVAHPRVLFADEPTRELDPAGRHQVWAVLRARRDAGVAVVLSTNLMDEAERLCDRVAILGTGRILAVDAPAGLVAAGGPPCRMTVDTITPLEANVLASLAGVSGVTLEAGTARIEISDPVAALQGVAGLVAASGCGLRRLRLSQATLEDRFVELQQDDAARARGAAGS